MDSEGKSLHLAQLINHSLQIIDKSQELSKLYEKVNAIRADLKKLIDESKNHVENEFKLPINRN